MDCISVSEPFLLRSESNQHREPDWGQRSNRSKLEEEGRLPLLSANQVLVSGQGHGGEDDGEEGETKNSVSFYPQVLSLESLNKDYMAGNFVNEIDKHTQIISKTNKGIQCINNENLKLNNGKNIKWKNTLH